MPVTRTRNILALSSVNDTYDEQCYVRRIQNTGTANFQLSINTGPTYNEPRIRQRGLANAPFMLEFDPPILVDCLRIEAKGTDDVIIELA